jgi:SAM-dependent methyltransferase
MTAGSAPPAHDWDSHWEQYDEAASLNPGQLMRQRLIMKLLASYAPGTPRLLDVGSGHGDFLKRASDAGLADAYAGFEFSESGVSKSRQRLPGVEFLQLDMFEPPAEADRFKGWATAAVCSEVLEHVDDPVAFLKMLKPYLAGDALLVVTVPGGPMSTFDRHIGHRRHYSSKLAVQTIEAAGYTVLLAGFPFFNLFRLAIILRGRRLIDDVKLSSAPTFGTVLSRFVMAVFRALFALNVKDSPFGWQVVAVARRSEFMTMARRP